MEKFIIIIITSIMCIASSVFFTPCDSLLASEYEYDHHLITHPAVQPRKLKLSDQDHEIKKDYRGGHQDLDAKQYEFLEGKSHTKEAKKMQSSIKTWREWVEEGSDTSRYFTMDYSRVRRRSPIHNKSLQPVAP